LHVSPQAAGAGYLSAEQRAAAGADLGGSATEHPKFRSIAPDITKIRHNPTTFRTWSGHKTAKWHFYRIHFNMLATISAPYLNTWCLNRYAQILPNLTR